MDAEKYTYQNQKVTIAISVTGNEERRKEHLTPVAYIESKKIRGKYRLTNLTSQ